MSVSPGQAEKPHGKLRQLARCGVERGVEEENSVAKGNIFARIAAIGGFDPGHGGGRIAAPVKFTPTRFDGVVNVRDRIFERLVSQLPAGTRADVDGKNALGKHSEGQ